jgi:GNAT superfamily N-acetyltransferase
MAIVPTSAVKPSRLGNIVTAGTTATRAAGIRLAPQVFESSILGYPVCRLHLPGDQADAQAISAAIEAARPRLVSCRIPADAAAASAALRAAGFTEIEVLQTFERAVPASMDPPQDVARAAVGDFATCIEIGRTVFRYDRFHADRRVGSQGADAIKAAWVKNGLNGRADAALVVRRAGRSAGFNLLRRDGDTASIDLIGVSSAHQGQGIGRALVMGGLAHYAGLLHRYQVCTQAANAVSVSLYRACGFVLCAEARTFHWFS